MVDVLDDDVESLAFLQDLLWDDATLDYLADTENETPAPALSAEDHNDHDFYSFSTASNDACIPPKVTPTDMQALLQREWAKLSPQDRANVNTEVLYGRPWPPPAVPSSSSQSAQVAAAPEVTETTVDSTVGDEGTTGTTTMPQQPNLTNASALLDEMLHEINVLVNNPHTDTTAYERALAQDPVYVLNPSWRNRFLQTCQQNPSQAALRYVHHYTTKAQLFDDDSTLLTRDVTQDDLDERTLAALYDGFSHFLPHRDAVGRLVHVQMAAARTYLDARTKGRLDFYMACVKSEDVTTLRHGCVGIRFYNGQWMNVSQLQSQGQLAPRKDNKDDNDTGRNTEGTTTSPVPPKVSSSSSSSPWSYWQAPQLLRALPIAPSALHVCHDSSSRWGSLVAMFRTMVGTLLRHRTVEHYGTHEACVEALRSYGIEWPYHEDDNIDADMTPNWLDAHRQAWMERREAERRRRRRNGVDGVAENHDNQQQPAASLPIKDSDEAITTTTDSSTTSNSTAATQSSVFFNLVQPRDVLLGRGKRSYKHFGNVCFRKLVQECLAYYNHPQTTVHDKKRLTKSIVQQVQQSGGRFLRETANGWASVDDETARLKVSHVFRNARSKAKTTASTASHRGSGVASKA